MSEVLVFPGVSVQGELQHVMCTAHSPVEFWAASHVWMLLNEDAAAGEGLAECWDRADTQFARARTNARAPDWRRGLRRQIEEDSTLPLAHRQWWSEQLLRTEEVESLQ